METLADLWRKFKYSVGKGISLDLLIIVSVVLVGMAGFGLGRLSVSEEREMPVQIVSSDSQKLVSSPRAAGFVGQVSAATPMGEVVASKNGTKYHLPECPGASRIAKSNKIYFSSRAEAERAGYSPAANCKGL